LHLGLDLRRRATAARQQILDRRRNLVEGGAGAGGIADIGLLQGALVDRQGAIGLGGDADGGQIAAAGGGQGLTQRLAQ